MFPKIRGGQTVDGCVWYSVRWLGIGWDSLFSQDGTRFVQYGRDPVRFILFKRPGSPVPRFLLNPFWKILRNGPRIKAGITTRPFDITVMWRHHAHRT